ncbi:MAG: hypothetical protein J2P28_11195 [Actinobacteria bacterium]|nr:hypothetical protein [Actinomycetota bacterium]
MAVGEPGCGPWWPGSTVSYLAGDWDVVREIADHRSGQAGKFRGRASFRPAGNRTRHGVLDFTEEGELWFGEYSGPASRSLRYRGRSDGSADVYFADGREFYRVHLGFGSCHAVHRCRADRYKVIVTMLSADSFSEIWRVTGPAKDYDLTTVYTRAGCTA